MSMHRCIGYKRGIAAERAFDRDQEVRNMSSSMRSVLRAAIWFLALALVGAGCATLDLPISGKTTMRVRSPDRLDRGR
jgi:hypothetical protein